MARERKGHVRDEGVLSTASSISTVCSSPDPTRRQPPTRLSLVKTINPTRQQTRHAENLRRIRSCLQTVAVLLETNHAYLPIFLRLEEELAAEQLKQDALSRSKTYLP